MLNTPTLSFTTLGSSNVSPVFGQPVTLTASVRPDNAVGQPTGSVSFYDLSAVGAPALLGTSPVSSGGQATLTLSSLAAGSHLVEAVYSGDSNFVFSLDELTEKVAQANPVPGGHGRGRQLQRRQLRGHGHRDGRRRRFRSVAGRG